VEVATVIPGSKKHTFVVTAVGAGNATVTVSDTLGNSFPVAVSVQ
jgi:hypothetical protein